MARLQDLPNELLLIIFNDVCDAKRLHPFLLTRQFHALAMQSLYRDLRLTIWDPTLPSAIDAVARGRLNTDLLLEKNLMSISLLTIIIGRNQNLLQAARSISLRLTEDNPGFLKELCRPPLSDAHFVRPLDASNWDMALAIIMQQPLAQLQTLTIDWIGTMPKVTECGLRMSTKRASNTVSIRGVRDSSDRFYSLVPFNLFISTSVPQVRFENVHFVVGPPKNPTPRPKIKPRIPWPACDLDIIDCKAMEPPRWRGWAAIGKARIIFRSDPYHAEILNVVKLSKCLHSLEISTRLPPNLEDQPGLAFQSYTKICSRGELRLVHLVVPFWLTPCDGPTNLLPLNARPLQVLTQLDLSLCINDVANLPSFSSTFAEKLQTIERIHFMPSLQKIKLIPSFWMREMPFLGHRVVFAKLLRMIEIDWENKSRTSVFGWQKSATTEDVQRHGRSVFRWNSGVSLNVTEIVKYVDNIEVMREE
ncbi:hypothetical protein BLS_001864 [Venturia inaequalis]|uniref:F-box domain-containing protein n=1 Tax=Venturia inaequalis TaxID=5025 RepID=A0A8H3VTV1_VENIN|nr:hypothetical protein BLS_001864 [Venturia inaequalis]KAE9971685.1 hypothetical protein EG328_005459 [Venturia inaequalis]KAE9992823.1 hypothetical protein EG327_007592 [Venturia inaequalis]RDI83170.1 hypothetical protein Vi05172_g6784 [Venturia inaequalis]